MNRSRLRLIRGRGDKRTKKQQKDPETRSSKRNFKLITRISNSYPQGNDVARKRQGSAGQDRGSKEFEPEMPEKEEGDDSLLSAISKVSHYVQNRSREVHLYVDESDGERRVSVVDSASGRVIRDIPQSELLKMSRHIAAHTSDPIKGLILRKKA